VVWGHSGSRVGHRCEYPEETLNTEWKWKTPLSVVNHSLFLHLCRPQLRALTWRRCATLLSSTPTESSRTGRRSQSLPQAVSNYSCFPLLLGWFQYVF
jgi:hypothetical protein